MRKKLITACPALVTLAAFALPAVASASPQITHPTGTVLLASNAKIKATQLGATRFTSTTTAGNGEVLAECASGTMTGTLDKTGANNEIEGTIETTAFSGTAAEGKCTGLGGIKVTTAATANGTPWCIRATNAMNPDEFQLRGGSCSTVARSITFQLDTGLGVNCSYERALAIKGTFTTDSTGDAILTISGTGSTGITDTGFTREGTNVLCPASGTLDMQFALETDSEFPEPLYIS